MQIQLLLCFLTGSAILHYILQQGKGGQRYQLALQKIVNELVLLCDTNVNALTRDLKTAYDIAERLSLSEETSEIKECLTCCGAVSANDLNQPRDELRKTVKEIKKDVHIQLEQAHKTNRNMNGIAKELRKLHRAGINNATYSITSCCCALCNSCFCSNFHGSGWR
ncbi:unnamed protein product [Citrullus colocynthis]|uniref:Uncharacterized protein n=1 Tax=Citrullus colocynthis TaxID=252529 RepID=A0ABP0YNA4_9ROSI